jgi:hypothetical protein
MHFIVSFIKKLKKALLLRFNKVYNINKDYKVRYKEV